MAQAMKQSCLQQRAFTARAPRRVACMATATTVEKVGCPPADPLLLAWRCSSPQALTVCCFGGLHAMQGIGAENYVKVVPGSLLRPGVDSGNRQAAAEHGCTAKSSVGRRPGSHLIVCQRVPTPKR